MKLFKLFLSIMFILCFISCDLNQLPKTHVTPDGFYKTEEEFVHATNDIYRQLGIVYDALGLVDIGSEMRSDNTYIKNTAGTNVDLIEINKFQEGPGNQRILNAWNSGYKALFVCNDVIERLKTTSVIFETPGLKERLIAEATTIRSLIFFDMVRDWGNILLPLKPLNIEKSYSINQVDQSDVYKQIINDLEESKKDLPEEYSGNDIGRITKYGAAAILAKVYLTMGEFQKAKAELKSIIDSKLYSLDTNGDGVINVEDYLYIFKSDTKNSKGSIVEVQYRSGTNGVNDHHQYWYKPFDAAFHVEGANQTARIGGEGGINTPTQDIINEFEPNDSIRLGISAAPGFYTLNSHEFVAYPYTRKFYDPDFRNAGHNFPIIRYADILLMYSEVTHVPEYLNMVRSRVGLPGYGEPGYPIKYNTLEKAIEHERRVALCFEFHRFYDLKRKGKAVEVMKAKGYNIDKKKLFLPIPQHVIDVNPKIKQNSGY